MSMPENPFPNLRNKSVAIGRGGPFGNSMARALSRYGMRPKVVGENPDTLAFLSNRSNSIVVHVPELGHPDSQEAVWWANRMKQVVSKNHRIVVLKGDYLCDTSATTIIIHSLIAQGCLHINDIEDWETELPKALSSLF